MEAFTHDLQSITLSPSQAVTGWALAALYMGLFPLLLLSYFPGLVCSSYRATSWLQELMILKYSFGI